MSIQQRPGGSLGNSNDIRQFYPKPVQGLTGINMDLTDSVEIPPRLARSNDWGVGATSNPPSRLISGFDGANATELVFITELGKLVSRYTNNCDYTREILVGGARGKNKAMP